MYSHKIDKHKSGYALVDAAASTRRLQIHSINFDVVLSVKRSLSETTEMITLGCFIFQRRKISSKTLLTSVSQSRRTYCNIRRNTRIIDSITEHCFATASFVLMLRLMLCTSVL